jgi:protein AroM
MSCVGVALIGRSPRPDIAEAWRAAAPDGTRFLFRGCLDGLDDDAIAAMAPKDDADVLYTRLPDGRDVRISRAAVCERTPETLRALRKDGAAVVAMNCTGAFPPIEGDEGVIFPSRLLAHVAEALVPRGRVAIVVPDERQRGELEAKWRRPGVAVTSAALAPHAPTETATDVARALAASRPDLVALDCMSYRPELRAVFSRETGAPTLVGIALASAIVGALIP